MKILVLYGPNLNMLGKRDVSQYGTVTLDAINEMLKDIAQKESIDLVFFQSNHEGVLIDFLQKYSKNASGILINPGALTHYGYSLRDALTDTKLPIVEVHLSNILEREAFRKTDVLDRIVLERFMGKREKSYIDGLAKLIKHIKNQKSNSKNTK
ncbi:MAG: 3-dehydroquinate dehydratase [Candidatus Levybacteria bacterium]|nr:3-dehydroquinate dehydratase [Candidatus Levybacteria bacterium]